MAGQVSQKGITVRIGSQTVLLPDLDEMSVDEMKSEITMWRTIFLGIDEFTRDLMYLIGRDAIVIMRNYQAVKGRIFGVVFKPEQVVIGGPVTYYDPLESKMKVAIALQRIPYANILSVNEIIQEVGEYGKTEPEKTQSEQLEYEENINETA